MCETVRHQKQFNPAFLQITRAIRTTVTKNGESASITKKIIGDSVPKGNPWSDSKLKRSAEDFMAVRFGKKAVGNTFGETICQQI